LNDTLYLYSAGKLSDFSPFGRNENQTSALLQKRLAIDCRSFALWYHAAALFLDPQNIEIRVFFYCMLIRLTYEVELIIIF